MIRGGLVAPVPSVSWPPAGSRRCRSGRRVARGVHATASRPRHVRWQQRLLGTGHGPARLPPEHHPRPGPGRASTRASSQERSAPNTLQTATFNAGPDAVDALFADSIDAAFIGPNPSINAFQKSNGQAIRIVAGSTSGGAGLVVKPSINSAADLKGKKIATPQLGNTQDVALRTYLKNNGLSADTSGGGDVSVIPQANADTLTQFASGDIDGAWVPEPFFTEMQQQSGGKVLVDERTLWPNGQFVTTNLVVATKFLQAHPDAVTDLIKGEDQAIKFIQSNPTDAQKAANDEIQQISGKPLKDASRLGGVRQHVASRSTRSPRR